jgi:hypothetical protein
MHNMCHTLDPLSPMGLVPGEYGIKTEMYTFTDYYRYCQRTAYARPGVARGGWRGYMGDSQRPNEIEAMARQWDDFCLEQEYRCYRIPWGW